MWTPGRLCVAAAFVAAVLILIGLAGCEVDTGTGETTEIEDVCRGTPGGHGTRGPDGVPFCAFGWASAPDGGVQD